ncbi:hypothetical protein QUF72_07820 [Desulfobacterales bacterium HSG2]|nr:hypothetical protein [Desulfobacterales bacterium HSG2]
MFADRRNRPPSSNPFIQALGNLSESVDPHPEPHSELSVLKGSRMPVAKILLEISKDAKISEIAEEYELDVGQVRNFIEGLAFLFSHSLLKK